MRNYQPLKHPQLCKHLHENKTHARLGHPSQTRFLRILRSAGARVSKCVPKSVSVLHLRVHVSSSQSPKKQQRLHTCQLFFLTGSQGIPIFETSQLSPMRGTASPSVFVSSRAWRINVGISDISVSSSAISDRAVRSISVPQSEHNHRPTRLTSKRQKLLELERLLECIRASSQHNAHRPQRPL